MLLLGRVSAVRPRRAHRELAAGAGESGKSTFSKQMKLLHLQGFNQEERMVGRRAGCALCAGSKSRQKRPTNA